MRILLSHTHRGYGRLITKDQNKGENQVRANKEEQ